MLMFIAEPDGHRRQMVYSGTSVHHSLTRITISRTRDRFAITGWASYCTMILALLGQEARPVLTKISLGPCSRLERGGRITEIRTVTMSAPHRISRESTLSHSTTPSEPCAT